MIKSISQSLKAKLTLLSLAIAILPLGLVSAYFLHTYDRSISAQIALQLGQNLQAGRAQLDGSLKQISTLLHGRESLATAPSEQILRSLVEAGVDSAFITDAQGRIVSGVGLQGRKLSGDLSWSEVTRRALDGREASGFEILPASFVAAQGLAETARIPLVETANARALTSNAETRALGLRAAVPLRRDGKVVGTLQVSQMLNGRFEIVDEIKAMLGVTATIFLEDVRVSTNVQRADGSRAIGTLLSRAVADEVLINGKPFNGRAQVAGDWYQTAYEPIVDLSGNRVGAFYVGVSEASVIAQKNALMLQVLGILVGVIALSAWAAIRMARGITKPVQDLTVAVEAIATGRLDQRVTLASEDELGRMARSFNAMSENLHQIIGRVRTVSGHVAVESDHLSTSASQLAHAAQTQSQSVEETSSAMEEMAASITQVAGNAQALAASVEETSSSIEEMASSVRQVAGHADTLSAAVSQTSASIEEMAASIQQVAGNVSEASQAAGQAAEVAHAGRTAVSQTVAGMERISAVMGDVVQVIGHLGQSSEEIGEIIAVIDDIAEQTNLLALNAAIEAARAGEHGRGFAVVADEVRKLAERSAKATGEIATLIKGIQKETEQAVASTRQGEEAIAEGTKLAGSAGQALTQIVGSVDRVSVQMTQIAHAAEEQNRAAAQITEAVDSMNRLTEQVMLAAREQAMGSEQIVKAVENMNHMTRQVETATTEQKKGGELVVSAVESINLSANDSAHASSTVAQAAAQLQQEARQLREAIAFFKEGASEEPAALRSEAAAGYLTSRV